MHYTKEKYDLQIIENAHIIEFASLIKDLSYSNLELSINPYNCLRIDKNTHKLIDDKKLFFDNKGNLIKHNNKIVTFGYLDIKNFPERTKKIFNDYLRQVNQLIQINKS